MNKHFIMSIFHGSPGSDYNLIKCIESLWFVQTFQVSLVTLTLNLKSVLGSKTINHARGVSITSTDTVVSSTTLKSSPLRESACKKRTDEMCKTVQRPRLPRVFPTPSGRSHGRIVHSIGVKTIVHITIGNIMTDCYHHPPSFRLLPMSMSMSEKLALDSMSSGWDVRKTPSTVGADGKPRMPE